MIAVVASGMHLREPSWLVLLVALPAIAWLWRLQRRGLAWSAAGLLTGHAATSGVAAPLPLSARQRLAWLPAGLQLLALALLVVAIARPVQILVEPPERLGRDVLLCLDRSSSMAVQDLVASNAAVDPAGDETRLQVGKRLAADFLAGRSDDRVGIVTFARFADLVCPPTADRVACAKLLAATQLVDAEGPEDATAIGAAVGMAAELLQRSQAFGKVIVLLTDGEENVATAGAEDEIAPLHAGQWCRDHDIRVHCIALGRGEQMGDGSWRALDTTAVQQLAKLSGGQFFRAANERALRAVYAQIDRLEAVQFADPGTRVIEWYAVPVMLALLALLAAHLWRRSRLGELR